MMMANKRNIESLLPLYFEGKLEGEELLLVERWVEESPEHRATAKDMAGIYRDVDTLFVVENTDDVEALRQVDKRLKRSRIKELLRKMERVAAVLLLPVLMLSIWQYTAHEKESVGELSFTANPGMTAKAQLPDGTTVVLNSNSTLSYPSSFNGEQREVKLSGEAYFAVAKDASHPFVVKTPYQASIRVYGTKFNVEAYPKDHLLTATLSEGSISLNYMDENGNMAEKMISPGQSISYRNYHKPQLNTEVFVDAAISWTEGKIIFKDTPAREVLRQLEKRYPVKFVVHSPQIYENRFTGTLEEQHLDRALYALSQTSNMKFKPRSAANPYQRIQVFDIYSN